MDVQERIRKQVTDNRVVLYMKGRTERRCSFSAAAVQILEPVAPGRGHRERACRCRDSPGSRISQLAPRSRSCRRRIRRRCGHHARDAIKAVNCTSCSNSRPQHRPTGGLLMPALLLVPRAELIPNLPIRQGKSFRRICTLRLLERDARHWMIFLDNPSHSAELIRRTSSPSSTLLPHPAQNFRWRIIHSRQWRSSRAQKTSAV